MQKDDSIPSAGAEADSEPKAEVTTSSSNNTKPNVVGSQYTPVSTEKSLSIKLNDKEFIIPSKQGSMKLFFKGFGEHGDGTIIINVSQFFKLLNDNFNFIEFQNECLPVVFDKNTIFETDYKGYDFIPVAHPQ